MNEQQLKYRTKTFALRILRLTEALPRSRAGDIFGRQLLRSATSVGANYRAACRARSRAAMIAKLDIVLEEIDESSYWLELISESGMIPTQRLTDLIDESEQLTAIVVASLKTLRRQQI
jgi:four helix bundle protein